MNTFLSMRSLVCSNKKTSDFIFIFETLVKTLVILGVTFNIDTLISDASEAIRNAFIVFGESVIIIMCWAHVRRNVVKQLHLVDEMYREDVMVDIDKLQLASSKEVFNKAKDLLIKNRSRI